MAEHPNVTLTKESLTAMEKGDMGWLESHMADDIVWHVGGNSKSAGTYKGRSRRLASACRIGPPISR